MPSAKQDILDQLVGRLGPARKLDRSNSLYEFATTPTLRVYFRYSAHHPGNRTFFGLRAADLDRLRGSNGIMCFLWDSQPDPLFVLYNSFSEVFSSTTPASDGQYKVQVYVSDKGADLYIARAGRFNVTPYFGWAVVDRLADAQSSPGIPALSHSQAQSLIAAIGCAQKYDVWIPPRDRPCLDLSLAASLSLRGSLPSRFLDAAPFLSEIDVIWIEQGDTHPSALFEVEHSTPIYSGLLRFNDVYLSAPHGRTSFTIVSNEERRTLFTKQIMRPTFTASRLDQICTFMPYTDLYLWHRQVLKRDVVA